MTFCHDSPTTACITLLHHAHPVARHVKILACHFRLMVLQLFFFVRAIQSVPLTAFCNCIQLSLWIPCVLRTI